MQNYIFDTTSGKIHSVYHGNALAETIVIQPFPCQVLTVLDEIDINNHFVDVASKTIKIRPTMTAIIDKTDIVADGTDVAKISGIITGTELAVEDKVFIITDDIFEFSTDVKGNFKVHLRQFPYLDKEFKINAV